MLRKLEKRFGKLAIPGLMKYVIVLYALGFVIDQGAPGFYELFLMLDVEKVLQGQLWRLVTFLIQPMDSNILFLLISLYLYYMIGSSLERQWGSFRFTLYYVSGVFFNIVAVFILYFVTLLMFGQGYSFAIGLEYINLSLFMAFAVEFSEVSLLLFFVIPIKIKYIAIFYGILEAYNVVMLVASGGMMGVGTAVAIVVAMLNFLIFFLAGRNYRRVSPKQIKRRQQYRKAVREGQSFGHSTTERGRTVITRHKCAVCGRTELDGDDLEFRYCSRCEGDFEYCMDHLYTHTHVVRERKE